MTIQYIRRLPGRGGDYGKVLEHSANYEWLCCSTSRYESDYSITQFGWSNSILPIPYVTTIDGINPLIPLLCRKLSIKQDKKSPLHYVITADYSSEPITQQEKNQTEEPNPLDRPPSIKWKTNKYTKAIYKDVDGNAIVNSAGEFFDPPPEVELFRWCASVSSNVEAVPEFILEFGKGGPINDSEFTIQGLTVSEGIARVTDFDISDKQTAQVGEDTVSYYVFSYSLEFRDEGWKLSLLDQGLRQVDPSDETKRIEITDDGSPAKPVKRPWPLDGEGGRVDDPSPENAVELDFDVIFPADFSVLPGLNL